MMDTNLSTVLIISLIWILITLTIYILYTRKFQKNLKSSQADFTSKLEKILGRETKNYEILTKWDIKMRKRKRSFLYS